MAFASATKVSCDSFASALAVIVTSAVGIKKKPSQSNRIKIRALRPIQTNLFFKTFLIFPDFAPLLLFTTVGTASVGWIMSWTSSIGALATTSSPSTNPMSSGSTSGAFSIGTLGKTISFFSALATFSIILLFTGKSSKLFSPGTTVSSRPSSSVDLSSFKIWVSVVCESISKFRIC